MWWDTKATININDYPTQIVWFEETADTHYTMLLLLKEYDILFTLYNVKFDNLAKLFKNISQDLTGITVQIIFEVFNKIK